MAADYHNSPDELAEGARTGARVAQQAAKTVKHTAAAAGKAAAAAGDGVQSQPGFSRKRIPDRTRRNRPVFRPDHGREVGFFLRKNY